MKFKFLSIIMAVAVALAFTSCDSKKASKSDASDSSKSEKVEEAKTFELTGDPAKDARQCATEMIDLMKNIDISNIKTAEDAEKWEKDFSKQVEDLQKKYEDFYKEKGEPELKKFQEEVEKLENDPELKKQLEDAQNKAMEKVTELMSKFNK